MNNKDKIHKYPIMQSNPYGNNEDFISQKDFYQILYDTKYCTLVTAKEFINIIITQIQEELKSLPRQAGYNIILKAYYTPCSEICFMTYIVF